MNELETLNSKTFESIKQIDEFGNEFWEARELQIVLEYKRWDKFINVINKAKQSCENSNYNVIDHFSHVGKWLKQEILLEKLMIINLLVMHVI